MRARFLFVLLVALIGLLLGTQVVWADGWIIPDPPPSCEDCPPVPPEGVPYLAVKYHRVTVTIENQVATTHIDQVFVNTSPWSLEGTYIFPLPEEAAINEFTMWVDGEPVQGQLYTREEARRIYEDIVRRRMDPALLEYVGRNLFQASIFPIPSGEERRIEIEYSEVLPAEGGLVRYVYPLSTERFSPEPLEDVSVSISIKSKEAIKAIYSPSHPVAIERDGAYRATVGWEDSDVIPTTDFALYYSVSTESLGVNLLSYKRKGEDGFFALLIAPDVQAAAGEVVAKDVIVVLDTSGSMEGEKIDQAKAALLYVLEHLNEGDRFNIVAFSTGLRTFSARMEPLSARREAERFVEELWAEGSTDINRALLEAMNMADEKRPTIIIFLTDGLPTAGVVEVPLIINNVKQATPKSVRLFTFGVGDDVDTVLLDTLARELRGASAYVRPGERVDEQVSAFYAKVSTPVLADVRLKVEGVRVEEIYPYPLPDVFAGSQLVVVGRYRQGGAATVELEGEVNQRPQTFRYEDLTFTSEGGEDFIPRLWATRKIGYLLNEIRLHGEDPELVDQIVKLSIRYGIITPYTSFLVEEPELALSGEGREEIVQKEVAERAAATPAPASGAGAVSAAEEQADLEAAPIAPPMAAPAQRDLGGGEEQGPVVATAGDKAFVLREGVWVDTTFDVEQMQATIVTVGSQEFFDLLRRYPEAAKYFALGERVIVVLDGNGYQSQPGEAAAGSAATSTPKPAVVTGEPYTVITANITSGQVPLIVSFSGELVGGADNDPDYYCQEGAWDFGDGTGENIQPECPKPVEGEQIQIVRSFSITHIYDRPGVYQVHFRLGSIRAEPLTITVSAPPISQPSGGGLADLLRFIVEALQRLFGG
mgnify:CR=1 FL=1